MLAVPSEALLPLTATGEAAKGLELSVENMQLASEVAVLLASKLTLLATSLGRAPLLPRLLVGRLRAAGAAFLGSDPDPQAPCGGCGPLVAWELRRDGGSRAVALLMVLRMSSAMSWAEGCLRQSTKWASGVGLSGSIWISTSQCCLVPGGRISGDN